MNYVQFNNYLEERAKRISVDKSIHQKFILEEEDCLDWKIASEMLESWLGVKKESISGKEN